MSSSEESTYPDKFLDLTSSSSSEDNTEYTEYSPTFRKSSLISQLDFEGTSKPFDVESKVKKHKKMSNSDDIRMPSLLEILQNEFLFLSPNMAPSQHQMRPFLRQEQGYLKLYCPYKSETWNSVKWWDQDNPFDQDMYIRYRDDEATRGICVIKCIKDRATWKPPIFIRRLITHILKTEVLPAQDQLLLVKPDPHNLIGCDISYFRRPSSPGWISEPAIFAASNQNYYYADQLRQRVDFLIQENAKSDHEKSRLNGKAPLAPLSLEIVDESTNFYPCMDWYSNQCEMTIAQKVHFTDLMERVYHFIKK